MFEIERLSKENKHFGPKLFLSYLIFTILLLSTITVIHIYFSKDSAFNKFQKETKLQALEKKEIYNTYLIHKKNSLLALAKNEYFIQFAKDKSYNYYIDLLFLTLMEANKDYMQMRFINEEGFEVLRFDRDKKNLEPHKVSTLQNKSNRYYFLHTSKLKKDEICLSDIDLNIEHKKIEKPLKPVLRISKSIYEKNKFLGILIINIFVEDLLKRLTSSSIYDIYLLDKNNYYLTHKNKKHDWSYYFSKRNIKDDFKGDILKKLIKNDNKALAINRFIFKDYLLLSKIKMIFVQKEENIIKENNNNRTMIISILIFSIIMALLFTFIFTKKINALFELVLKQKNKLQDLAKSLDLKVKEKTKDIAKKDRLLQNQNKLAELGDMIANIAHQWRQPLTRLSLIIQNLKAYKKKDKMTDRMFLESMNTSLYQIEFMSNTIDNFKNFYKKDTYKSEFLIKDAIHDVLNIISSVLKHKNIIFSIYDEKDVKLYGNKNEFSHVLMNLIINAKDAIEEKEIINPKIEVFIKKLNHYIEIEVKDNAKGINDEIISKIFNPYFTTKAEKGTGIGLYLSKAIIEDKLNGKISVQNSKEGAVFTIRIKEGKNE